MMGSFAITSVGAFFLSNTIVNYLDVAFGWGILGTSTVLVVFGAGLVVFPTALIDR